MQTLPDDDEDDGRDECICCSQVAALDPATNLCGACLAERDAHPVWQAIRRVERGEVTVARHGDLDPWHFSNYELKTSDGWVFEIFPDGVPFDDWDYIHAVTGPDGVRWEPWIDQDRYPAPPHLLPTSVWFYRPSDEHRAKWCLEPRPTCADRARMAWAALAALFGRQL